MTSQLVHTADDYWIISAPGGYWSQYEGTVLRQSDAAPFVNVRVAKDYLARWRRPGTRAWIVRVVKRPSKDLSAAQRACQAIAKLRELLKETSGELWALRRSDDDFLPMTVKLDSCITKLDSELRELQALAAAGVFDGKTDDSKADHP